MPRHSESTLAAIKQSLDLVALVGEYLPLHRSGSKYKALCPFHDDHNPSLELNPERQSYKCWSCGAGGDIFDFVKNIERVDFSEALRMLAERAGVTLEGSAQGPNSRGPSRTELMAVTEWAERAFAEALADSAEARAYVEGRGISAESVVRFRLGFAPESRDWLLARARKEGHSVEVLERVGLVSRPADRPGRVHERFRGRLMFPIHDLAGRVLGFGGRVLPAVERAFAEAGKGIAKYLNSPETVLFQKRRILYAADLARAAARESGWVAVVEGYTDVIAAHQAGLHNVVGTLGTALGDDHVQALRRLADRVVLVFDGDEAGQIGRRSGPGTLPGPRDRRPGAKLAGRPRPVRLPDQGGGRRVPRPGRPCGRPAELRDRPGRGAVRPRLARGLAARRRMGPVDPRRASPVRTPRGWTSRWPRPSTRSRNGCGSPSRPSTAGSRNCNAPPAVPSRKADEPRRPAGKTGRARIEARGRRPAVPMTPIRPEELDPIDRELVQIALNEPLAVGRLVSRVAVASIRDAPLRAILAACYDLHGEGESTTFERVALRLDDARVRSLAAGLLLPTTATRGDRHPIDPQPVSEGVRPAPWEVRLAQALAMFDRTRSARSAEGPQGGPGRDRRIDPSRRASCPETRILSTSFQTAGHEDEKRVLTRRSVRESSAWKNWTRASRRSSTWASGEVSSPSTRSTTSCPTRPRSPEKIHGLLESLDELGIELINEDEAEARLLASGDIDDEPEDAVDEPVDDDDGELTPEDLDEISRRIDDPVRMYLTQMGEIPLLTRDQEIALAKKIEVTRKRFRRKVLECDYALRPVVDVLKKVNDGELPFDRTVKVSVTENLEKDKILGRMPHNLKTLEHLMECNNRDFRAFVRDAATSPARRTLAAELKNPPPQGGHAGRGAVDPHAEGPAADEEARADLGADGRAGWPSSRTTAPAAAARKTAPTCRKSSTT